MSNNILPVGQPANTGTLAKQGHAANTGTKRANTRNRASRPKLPRPSPGEHFPCGCRRDGKPVAPASPIAAPTTVPIPVAAADGTPVPPGEPDRNRKTLIRISFPASQIPSEVMTQFYPGFQLSELPHLSTHQHPRLALDRVIAERIALRLARKRMPSGHAILDIGGNPSRHKAYSDHDVWSCCPLLSRADASRNLTYANATQWCTHTAQCCTCLSSKMHACIAVHSLYYLDPVDILMLTARSPGGVFAVLHSFPDFHGTIGEEASYTVDGDGNVTMSVVGNDKAYRHSSMAWMRRGGFEAHANGKQLAMVWSQVATTEYSRVWHFASCPPGLDEDEANPTSFSCAYSDDTYYGSLKFPSGCSDQTPAILQRGSIWAAGGTLVMTVDDVTYPVHKSLVNYAAEFCAGKDRSPELYASTITQVKRYAEHPSRKDLFPPGRKALGIVICAALGFALHARDESELLSATLSTHMFDFFSLKRALRFEFPELYRPPRSKWWLYFSCFLSLIFSFSFFFAIRTEAIGATAGEAFVLGVMVEVVLLLLLLMLWALFRSSTLARDAYVNRVRPDPIIAQYNADFTSSCVVGEGRPFLGVPVPVAAYVSGNAPRDDIAEGATCEEPLLPSRIKNSVGATPVGFLVSSSIPVVPSSSLDNERVAMCNRALVPQPPTTPESWAELSAWEDKFFDQLYPGLEVVQPLSFEEWNQRFPAPRQKMHVAAHKRIEAFGLNPRRDCQRKAFVKVEKTQFKSEVGQMNDFDPRLIQGVSDEANVILGPWMVAISKALSRSWSPSHFITYAAGLNANEVGAWFDLHAPGCDAAAESDQSRFDAHVSTAALESEIAFYQRLGLHGPALTVLREQLVTRGYTAHGLKYSCTATRKSGDPNTSLGNSRLSGLIGRFLRCSLLARSLGESIMDFPPSRLDVATIVMGDDDASLGTRHHLFTESDMISEYLRFGFEIKYQIHADCYLLSFCSGRFYPSTRGTILGPKIGRLISRMGWALKKNSRQREWLRGVAIANVDLTRHIPFLYDLVEKTRALTQGCKAVACTDRPMAFQQVATAGEPCPETWAMLDVVYGVSDQDLVGWRRMLSNVRSLPHWIGGDLVDRLVAVDAA